MKQKLSAGSGSTVGSDKPHLIFVAHAVGGSGGMERTHEELLRRLVGQWNVTVLSVRLAKELRPLVRWVQVKAPSRPVPLMFVTFFLIGGLKLRRLSADLVHTCGAIVPNKADLTSVHLCHAGLLARTGRLAPAEAPLIRQINTTIQHAVALKAEQFSYRKGRLGHFHAVSPGIAAELSRYYPDVPIAIIPNGVDGERFAPDAISRSELRNRQRVSANDLVALFVGGDWDHKGLSSAISGVSYARQRNVPARLWIVGAGRERRFKHLAADADIDEFVTFFGHQADPAPFYNAADILVLPSRYESFSLVAFEAASAGLPLVATAVYGVTELIGMDQAGLLVPGSADGVGAALVKLANSKLRQAMGSEARRRAQLMTWEASAQQLKDLLDHLNRRSD